MHMRPCIPRLSIRQQNVSHPSRPPTGHEAAKPLGRMSLSRVPLCAPLPPYPLTTLLSRESLLGYPGSTPTHSSSLGELSDLDLPVTLPSTFLLTHSPLEPPEQPGFSLSGLYVSIRPFQRPRPPASSPSPDACPIYAPELHSHQTSRATGSDFSHACLPPVSLRPLFPTQFFPSPLSYSQSVYGNPRRLYIGALIGGRGDLRGVKPRFSTFPPRLTERRYHNRTQRYGDARLPTPLDLAPRPLAHPASSTNFAL